MTPEEIASKGERTHQAILDAAYDLFLSQGYSATSMRQIAERADLALGGIYNHFAGKDEIFQALIIEKHPYLQIMPLISAAPGKTTEEFLRNAAQIVEKTMAERPDFMKLMMIEIVEFNGKHFPKLYQTLSPSIYPVLQRFNLPDSGVRPLPLPVLLRTLMGSIVAHYITAMLMSDPSLPAEMRNVKLSDFIEIYMHGILECKTMNAG